MSIKGRGVTLRSKELSHSLNSIIKDPFHCHHFHPTKQLTVMALTKTPLDFCCPGACHANQKNLCRKQQFENRCSPSKYGKQENSGRLSLLVKSAHLKPWSQICGPTADIVHSISAANSHSFPHHEIPLSNSGRDPLLHQSLSKSPEVQSLTRTETPYRIFQLGQRLPTWSEV